MISRRQFLAGVAAVPVVSGAYGIIGEPRRITVSKHDLGANSGSRPVRMVQLSDLHLQRVSRHARRIARRTNELNPDIILLTGDLIDRPDRLGELETFLGLLEASTAKFAVLGNWEHWARVDVVQLREIYARHACRLLINETAVHSHSSGDVLITGMDDWTGGAPNLGTALNGVESQGLHLVLAHSPVYRDVMLEQWARVAAEGRGSASRIVLSGHTHGGQVAFFGWAPVRPAGSGDYVSGWYDDAELPMYVSRGLGTSLAPIRFGAPPEIALFNWRPGAI